MRMYIDWFDTERISTATAPHTLSSRSGIKLVGSSRGTVEDEDIFYSFSKV